MKRLISKFVKWYLNKYLEDYVDELKKPDNVIKVYNADVKEIVDIPDTVNKVLVHSSIINTLNLHKKTILQLISSYVGK